MSRSSLLTHMHNGLRALAVVTLACAVLSPAMRGRAEDATSTTGRERTYTADPNAATFGFEYRGAVRGRFGDVFSLYNTPEGKGYGVAVVPFIELHEPRSSQNVLPSQYWRARLAIAQSYGFVRPTRRFHIDLVLSHESDHETAHAYSHPGFLALNDVTARARYVARTGPLLWGVRLDAQMFFLSCTVPSRPCRNFRGDSSAGAQAEAFVALPDTQLYGFRPFAALHGSAIASHGLVREEARLSTRLGVSRAFTETTLSIFALGWLGNDIGVVRNRSMALLGGGVAFKR